MLDRVSSKDSDHILCYYPNTTNQIQVFRIGNIPNWYFERVVFPGERLMFKAAVEAVLEIHTCAVATAILSDKIPCYVLRFIEEVGSELALVFHKEKCAVLSR
ncbi:DUF1830 domain-containing protein [Tychonema sp. LEGE 06208]|uniref:DUF1830 domain-containing protein n=1 Tax=Tychonema sp. LEGE 06208 TaxID=1828663 RepID=UPI0018826D3A|nr:DUF1830 domain-containing protein [Tychonema sp. LEGE 06208]MBE9162996.1 DUF1830 domain-containing protein [Tychonema sp. LEGE 06208]